MVITFNLESQLAIFSHIVSVESEEPSFTTITSRFSYVCFNILSKHLSIVFSELYVGTITDITGFIITSNTPILYFSV